MGEKIESMLNREIKLFQPGDVLAGARITRELCDNSDLMDRVRGDSRCVGAKGYDSEYREKNLTLQKRAKTYAKALDLIKADARFVPADGAYDFYVVATKLASGASVSGEEAAFAADIFARYEVFYQDLLTRISYGLEDLSKIL